MTGQAQENAAQLKVRSVSRHINSFPSQLLVLDSPIRLMKSLCDRSFFSFVLLTAVTLAAPRTLAATLLCTNSGNWADPAVWSPNQIPGPAIL